jgi:hypothetical protein
MLATNSTFTGFLLLRVSEHPSSARRSRLERIGQLSAKIRVDMRGDGIDYELTRIRLRDGRHDQPEAIVAGLPALFERRPARSGVAARRDLDPVRARCVAAQTSTI